MKQTAKMDDIAPCSMGAPMKRIASTVRSLRSDPGWMRNWWAMWEVNSMAMPSDRTMLVEEKALSCMPITGKRPYTSMPTIRIVMQRKIVVEMLN